MTSQEIREKFIKFFEERGHKEVPSSSLLPTDSSVLFTTAGMQQFKPYYTGTADAMKDFGSLNTVSIQKSMRTSDIDSVGDESHLTFFEMLGNFSFGGYWKKEAIEYAHEFITKEMGLNIDYVSVFAGEGIVPPDEESENIWKSVDSSITVKRHGRADNFWGPTGSEGPCGPTTEIYVNGLEVWNIVFNQYYQHADKHLEPLKIQGIDTGMGLERLAMVIQQKQNIFETDLFEPLIKILPENIDIRVQRIMVDHARASTFLISDGVVPSNKEQGYVLRRLLRRLIVHAHMSNIETEVIKELLLAIIKHYSVYYPNLNSETILSEFNKENDKFQKTFKNGLKELEKLTTVDGASAFKLFESFGLPFEIIKEVGGDKVSTLTREEFEAERKRHQEISRAGVEKKFGGHGIKEGDLTAGNTEEMKKVTRLHTATHIIVASLQKVLGQKLPQAGADITVERLRFDFTFPRKVTPEELKQAEDIANEIVEKDLPVTCKEMDLQEALDSGASAFFKLKYPPRVKVYTVGDESDPFSRELCGGPHVSHTAEIGHITITKEESVSGGNRRIRAIVD
ncbi:MAG: alanine--tRNA ligase-related protein [bacterium]|nr:alanine--tRNA ligase-related protein [bacterium]